MDRQRVIIYSVVIVLVLGILLLNAHWGRQTAPPQDDFPSFSDRSQQSEFERGAGTMRDAKAFKEWAKKNLPDD
ncbi:MAG TPA: hypothetical protein PKO06_07010 [Candidatus Ozemobacteraceae bacterium]|nr:hypothetical protein [Candidatus Ozemobacteraceae bacterium]